MKKKAKSGASKRRAAPAQRPKIGGKTDSSSRMNWSRVGRRRLEKNEGIKELATTLKQLREDQGLTVTQIAKDLGIAPATLIKFEDRCYPVSVKVVIALAEKLGHGLQVTPGVRKKS